MRLPSYSYSQNPHVSYPSSSTTMQPTFQVSSQSLPTIQVTKPVPIAQNGERNSTSSSRHR
jgi:hypothetical protein